MSFTVLSRILPEDLQIIVDSYLYFKDQKFIRNKMNDLSTTSNTHKQKQWLFLIKFTKNVPIIFQNHQLYGFNFAYFIESVLKYRIKDLPLVYRFCVQSIQNNPELLNNQYYVGNGGCPAFEQIFSYLMNRTMNGSILASNQQIQDLMFHIFRFILEQQLLGYNEIRMLFDYSQFGPNFTKNGLKSLQLLLQYSCQYFKFQIIKGDHLIEHNNYQCLSCSIENFLQKLLSNYNAGELCNRYSYKLISAEQIQQIRQQTNQVLSIIGTDHQQILMLCRSKIINLILRRPNIQLIIYLHNIPGFKRLMQQPEFILLSIQKRNRQIIQFLWSFEENKEIILKTVHNGKNILELLADSRGLVHNLITLFWESGYFERMPFIKNNKSRSIIEMRFRQGIVEMQ